jgi:hypothetical protein
MPVREPAGRTSRPLGRRRHSRGHGRVCVAQAPPETARCVQGMDELGQVKTPDAAPALNLLHLARAVPGLALLIRHFMFLLTAPFAVSLLLLWIVCHNARKVAFGRRERNGMLT